MQMYEFMPELCVFYNGVRSCLIATCVPGDMEDHGHFLKKSVIFASAAAGLPPLAAFFGCFAAAGLAAAGFGTVRGFLEVDPAEEAGVGRFGTTPVPAVG